MKKKIIYISVGDGADMRANKEIISLSKNADIYFLGMGDYGEKNYVAEYCKNFFLIPGRKKSLFTVFRHVRKFIEWSREFHFDSVHIVNEQLMFFFYPMMFGQHVVLDLYDSIFLKLNIPGNRFRLLKKLVYAPATKILVTDWNRRSLMPDFAQNRTIVLENYPNRYTGSAAASTNGLTVFYTGSMSDARGTRILQALCERHADVSVIMAGWINDENTRFLSQHSGVEYRGIVTREESMRIAAEEVDYIMCVYEPSNQNNINASPNKIYDAIQACTPVIVNREIASTSFVEREEIGIVIDSFYDINIDDLYERMVKLKGVFSFSAESANRFCWEAVEDKLLLAHNV